MPVICRFLGIAIIMYWNDHNPPHFHVKYAGHNAIITIEDGSVIGEFPKRALSLVMEWLEIHKAELIENWLRASNGEEIRQIAPLE